MGVKECLEQFPKIMGPENMTPDYDKCIRISTEASLREMLAPGALVIFSPLVAGLGFGKNACAGLLSGALCLERAARHLHVQLRRCLGQFEEVHLCRRPWQELRDEAHSHYLARLWQRHCRVVEPGWRAILASV